jgi:hypothetical protein
LGGFSNKTQARLFSVFYRVGFIGEKWGDLANREYIYKESAMVRVADFTQRIKVFTLARSLSPQRTQGHFIDCFYVR